MGKKRSIVLILLGLTLFSLLLSGCNFTDIDTSISGSSDISGKLNLKLNYEKITLCVGESVAFIPEFSDGEKHNVTYESNASYVAYLEKNILTAQSLGMATIKAKAENGEEAICSVNVIEAPKMLSLSR